MWGNNQETVNKAWIRWREIKLISNEHQSFRTYPQISINWMNKIWLTYKLKQIIHIFTTLIVIINFYI